MKLDSIARSLAGTFAGATIALACACHPVPVGAPSNNQPPPMTQGVGSALMAADGKHFAVSRTYQGECMPAGSRGGCYSVTLNPDGSYRNMLLDAAVMGTYEIVGDAVHLTPSGEALPTTMTLSADRTRLDDYVYQPPVEP